MTAGSMVACYKVTHYASKMWLPQLLYYTFLAVVVTLLVWNNTEIDFADCRNKKFGKLENEQVVKVIWQQAASPMHTDGSMAFARWRQRATQLTHASLGPPESKSQTTSRSVQPFLHSSLQSVPMLYNGPPLPPPQNCPFPRGYAPLSNTWFPGPTWVINPNGISIGSAVFAGLGTVTDRPTDSHATQSVTLGCICVHRTAIWPKKLFRDKISKSAIFSRKIKIVQNIRNNYAPKSSKHAAHTTKLTAITKLNPAFNIYCWRHILQQ